MLKISVLIFLFMLMHNMGFMRKRELEKKIEISKVLNIFSTRTDFFSNSIEGERLIRVRKIEI